MAKEKKDLTPTELFKKKRNTGYALIGAKWLSILSPYFIIGAVNFEEYFTEYNGVKMSLGCVLALVVAGIAIVNETKENKKINGLVAWAVAFVLIYLMQTILNDLLLIVGCGFVGQLVGAGFEIGAKNQIEKANLIKKGIYENASLKQAIGEGK